MLPRSCCCCCRDANEMAPRDPFGDGGSTYLGCADFCGSNRMSEGRQSQVVLLDDRRLDILIKPKLYAGELLDMVASHFSLKEKEYFGLAYPDDAENYSWLQLDRRVLEHEFPKRSTSTPLVLYFRIKYFVESITHLRDSSTVEAFYLQTQSLVYNGLIEVGSDKAFQLAALVLQATHGDYSSDTLAKQQLKKLPILPTSALVDHPSLPICEQRVLEQYISLQGLSRGAAIVNYMRIAESLPTYGFHYYEVKDKSGIPWWLGISYKGICQYDQTDRKVPRKLFLWKQLENLYFRDRKFSIEVYDPKRVNASRKTFSPGNISVHVWFANSPSLTKCIWSMAISQHQFYLDRKHNKSLLSSSRNFTDIADELSHGSYSTETSSLGRSVSSLSLPTLKLDSDSCDEALDTAEMFVALKARKEALEKVLSKKYNELTKICVREGELTGALPPEMPLSPGEQIPIIRRRVGGPVTDKMLWKRKTKDEEELAHLELEYEIQTKIVSAALKLLNDCTLKKNIRRQRKLSHQKALQKLKEIEQKLMHLRKKEYLSKDEAYHSNNDALIQQTSANLKDLSITFSPTENEKEDAKNTLNKMTSSPSLPLPSLLRAGSSSVPSSPRNTPRHRNSLASDPQHDVHNNWQTLALRPDQQLVLRPDLQGYAPGSLVQGYTPSSVYQTQTSYRSQQYPTFSMRSPGSTYSSPSSCEYTDISVLTAPYRNKYESTLDLDGSNIYSVPTQRTSQAFDTQDDILATVPAPPQDLGLVSRHNSLDRNRRHSSQKQRRYMEAFSDQSGNPTPAYSPPPAFQDPQTRVSAYPFHHPHHYHHLPIKSPTRQHHTHMYQQNLKLYGADTMRIGDKKLSDEKQSLAVTPHQKHLSISPTTSLQRQKQSSISLTTSLQRQKWDIKPSTLKDGQQSLVSHQQQHSSVSLDDRLSLGSHQQQSSVSLDDRLPLGSHQQKQSLDPGLAKSHSAYEGGLVSPSGGGSEKKWVQTSMSVDSFKSHVDVVEYGEFKPYWEETKPYETSDFLKYSTRHRKQQHQVASQSLHAKILAWKATQQSGPPPPLMSPVLERSRTASPAPCTTQQPGEGPSVQDKREGSISEAPSGSQAAPNDAMHNDILDWYSKQEKGKKTTLV